MVCAQGQRGNVNIFLSERPETVSLEEPGARSTPGNTVQTTWQLQHYCEMVFF